MVVSKNIFSCDHALKSTVGWVNDEQVPAVVYPELFQDLVELVVDAHSQRALNHVRAQVDPLIMAVLDHVGQHVRSVRFVRMDIHLEDSPVEDLVSGGLREAVPGIVVKVKLINAASLLVGDSGAQERSSAITANVVQAVLVLGNVSVSADHLGPVDALLVVELLMFKHLDDEAFGNETDEAACGVDHGVGIVVGRERLLAGLHVGDR